KGSDEVGDSAHHTVGGIPLNEWSTRIRDSGPDDRYKHKPCSTFISLYRGLSELERFYSLPEVENKSYRECSGEKTPSISIECVVLRETYFNCKRGQAKSDFENSCFKDVTENVDYECFVILFIYMAGLAPEGSQFDGRQYDSKMNDLYVLLDLYI
ncbi:hypothetical protein IFM89_000867, partial [Coptis chinensis]